MTRGIRTQSRPAAPPLFPGIMALLALLLFGEALAAQDSGEETAKYTRAGADTCLKCHDDDSALSAMAIFRTPHGRIGDDRTPFAGLQCEACHGPGDKHAGRVRGDEVRTPVPFFSSKSPASADEHNAVCLGCHREATGTGWPGSTHEENETACNDCHQVHVRKDPVLQVALQTDICLGCHKDKRADLYKPSSHPLRQGEMACSNCHNPHGSAGEHLLIRTDVNQTCFDCHADKRGPHLWEHAPAAEDCSLCHKPHGSNHPALLTHRPPQLCQQCHSRAGHPAVAYTPAGLPDRGASAILLARSCVNCHTQVHGSNHPSGASLTR